MRIFVVASLAYVKVLVNYNLRYGIPALLEH